jgi:hypothetical protein
MTEIPIRTKAPMTNTAFTIFHIPGTERDKLFKKSHNTMSKHFSELKTETVLLKEDKDIEDFFKNKDIVMHREGFPGRGESGGWKIGELGLWASTYLAIKNFLNSPYENLIIMEDDIVLYDNFVDSLNYYMNDLPSDWNLFFAYTPEKSKKRYYNDLEETRKTFEIGKKNIVKTFGEECTMCYVISKTGAKKLIRLFKEPIRAPIDWYLLRDSKLPAYCLRPEIKDICEIGENFSQIQNHPRKLYSFFPGD